MQRWHATSGLQHKQQQAAYMTRLHKPSQHPLHCQRCCHSHDCEVPRVLSTTPDVGGTAQGHVDKGQGRGSDSVPPPKREAPIWIFSLQRLVWRWCHTMHHATNVVKKLHELDGASPSRHSSPGNIHYAVIPDYLNSVASVSEVPRGADPWKVYTVDLIDVGTVMKERKQGWNQQYAAAARIFNDDLSGQALRATIHMQYKQMFVTSPGTKRGVLASGREFLQLMHCGVVRGKPRMFTYVIMEDRMTFTETGRAMKVPVSPNLLPATPLKTRVTFGRISHPLPPIPAAEFRRIRRNLLPNCWVSGFCRNVLPVCWVSVLWGNRGVTVGLHDGA